MSAVSKNNVNSAKTVKVKSKFMKTYSAKPTDVVREWYLVDASVVPLGRMSTKIATMLTGKEKPMFTAHIDCGDYVIVVNSDNLVTTGNKLQDKKYYRHSQYPGSLKEASLSEKMQKDSCEVVRLAVKGMLPKNKLMDERLKRLKIYKGNNHSHEAQRPQKVNLK